MTYSCSKRQTHSAYRLCLKNDCWTRLVALSDVYQLMSHLPVSPSNHHLRLKTIISHLISVGKMISWHRTSVMFVFLAYRMLLFLFSIDLKATASIIVERSDHGDWLESLEVARERKWLVEIVLSVDWVHTIRRVRIESMVCFTFRLMPTCQCSVNWFPI